MGQQIWNNPLYFFAVLTVVCFFSLTVCFLATAPNPTPASMQVRLVAGVICFPGVVGGLACMILSLIPPVRRLLAWILVHRFFWLACLVTLIALFYAEEDWRGWHSLKNFEAQWTPTGAKFSLMEVAPPPVPEDQNFALTPIVSGSYATYFDKSGHEIYPRDTNVVNRLSMDDDDNDAFVKSPGTGNWKLQTVTDLYAWQKYYRDLAARTNLFPVPAQPGAPAADVLLALGKYDSAIEELRQASQLPYSRFPLSYERDEPAGILLPHLASLKRVSVTLKLRAIAEEQTGQMDQALADVKLMLYLNNAIRTEPFLISHLVRMALLDITLTPVYEGLAAHRWSDTQLAGLDAELAKQDYLADFKTAMSGELGLGITETDYLRRQRDFQALDYSSDGQRQQQPAAQDIALRLIPSGFFYQSELQLARANLLYLQPSVDLDSRTISPSTVKHNKEAAVEDLKGHRFTGVLARMTVPAVFDSVKKFAQAQADLDMARLAIALERYRLAHGEYPGSLDALAPQFIAKVPHDVINGDPYRYRRTEDGRFVLYSVGWNETDDGGVVAYEKGTTPNMDPNQGDWVWKYPAK